MQLAYNNKFKPNKTRQFQARIQKNAKRIGTLVIVLFVTIYLITKILFSPSFKLVGFGSLGKSQYPKYHGYYKTEIGTKSSLIFPSIEHAPLLRELTVDSLLNYQIDPNTNEKRYLLTDPFDDDDSKLNNKLQGDETDQMIKVKNSFLDHGKQRFVGSKSPEIVIVTGIDFEKNELSYLTKIVQNRVNYAQKKGYGVYVRWVQEFLPFLSSTKEYQKQSKLFILRAAMFAFPNAKYFWYIEDNSLIMKYDIDLYKYLIKPEVLDPILMRDQPLIPPNGIIHTFKNTKASNVELILTQLDQDLNLDSFIIKNSFYARSLIEFWSDELFRNYHNFNKHVESSLLHILQWHPIYLARTGLVPSRTIASLHSALENSEDDDIHYQQGDFVVNLRDCEQRGTCGKELDAYWNKLEGKK